MLEIVAVADGVRISDGNEEARGLCPGTVARLCLKFRRNRRYLLVGLAATWFHGSEKNALLPPMARRPHEQGGPFTRLSMQAH